MQFGIAAILFKQSSLFQNLILTMQAANESNSVEQEPHTISSHS